MVGAEVGVLGHLASNSLLHDDGNVIGAASPCEIAVERRQRVAQFLDGLP